MKNDNEKVQLSENGREFTILQIKNMLKNRKLIVEPNKYTLTARQITYYDPKDNPEDEGNQTPRYIVNLQATTVPLAEQAAEHFSKEEYQDAMNSNISGTVFVGDNGQPNGFLPQNGEVVDVEIGWVPNREGNDILGVTSMTKRKAVSAGTAASIFDKAFSPKTELEEIEKEAKKETVKK